MTSNRVGYYRYHQSRTTSDQEQRIRIILLEAAQLRTVNVYTHCPFVQGSWFWLGPDLHCAGHFRYYHKNFLLNKGKDQTTTKKKNKSLRQLFAAVSSQIKAMTQKKVLPSKRRAPGTESCGKSGPGSGTYLLLSHAKTDPCQPKIYQQNLTSI